MFRCRLFLTCVVFVAALVSSTRAESYAEAELKQIVTDQKAILAEAERDPNANANPDLKNQLQQVVHRYDVLVRDNPEFTPAYVSYGLLLNKVGMKKEALRLFLKANQLDPNLAVVKNQLGSLVAEGGQPLEALPYFIAAIDLEPREPLYHYQLGTLLASALTDFLQAGHWTRDKLDQTALNAFREANRLAPSDWRYAYRYGLAFYDLEKPQWEDALAFWQAFEPRLTPGLEQQVCRLHQAKVLVEMGRREEAVTLLDSITEPSLDIHRKEILQPKPAPAETPSEAAPTPTK